MFFILIIYSVNNLSLAQDNVPNFFEVEYNFKLFKDNGLKRIIITGYYKGDLNSKDHFIRGDKSVYTFEDSLIERKFLNKNNKPYKKVTQYFKQDSMGNLFFYDKKYGSNYNDYLIKNSLIMRDHNYKYNYDDQNRLIKRQTIDTLVMGNVNYTGGGCEYKYLGDSVRETYDYKYTFGNPQNKFNETITKVYFINKRAYKFITMVYDYAKQKYVQVASGTYHTIKTDTGFKYIETYFSKAQDGIYISEFLY